MNRFSLAFFFLLSVLYIILRPTFFNLLSAQCQDFDVNRSFFGKIIHFVMVNKMVK